MAVSFSLGRFSLAKQVLVLALSVSLAVAAVVAGVTVWQGNQAANAAVKQSMMDSLSVVNASLVATFESTRLRIERQVLVVQRLLGELPSPDDTTTPTGVAGDAMTVRAGETVLNGNTAALQRLRSNIGVDLELVVRQGDHWIRAATLRPGSDGRPLTGQTLDAKDFIATTLDSQKPASTVLYRDGHWLALHVRPLKDDSGKLFGGLAVQTDMSDEVNNTLAYLKKTTVAQYGRLNALTARIGGRAEFLVHPLYQGKTLDAVPPADRPFYDKLVDTNDGFLEIQRSTDSEPQLVGYQTVPNWGWTLAIVGAKSDFLAAERRQTLVVVALLLVGGLLTGAITFWRMASALRPVGAVVGGISRLGDGDLTQDVPAGPKGSGNEIHVMAERINATRGRIAQLARQMSSAGSEVASASSQTLEALSQIGKGTEVQSEAASGVAAAIEELTVSITQIADNTREANQFSQSSSEAAAEGAAVVDKTVAEIERMAGQIADSAELVRELEASSRQISDVVKTIQGIAGQTNLLALNAAIEAARAGEEGRGFSVVADEVRELAERTKTSTGQIADVIAAVQKQTAKAAAAMRQVNTEMQESAAGARQAGTVLGRIREATGRTAEVIGDISNAAAEQKSASEQIAGRVEQIAQYAEESASAVQQSVASAESLQHQARVLDETIRTLRT